MANELKFENYNATQEIAEDVDLERLVQLFVNHRCVRRVALAPRVAAWAAGGSSSWQAHARPFSPRSDMFVATLLCPHPPNAGRRSACPRRRWTMPLRS